MIYPVECRSLHENAENCTEKIRNVAETVKAEMPSVGHSMTRDGEG
jgi:predicted ATP-grasp superfamily ATP-dependent carboligase